MKRYRNLRAYGCLGGAALAAALFSPALAQPAAPSVSTQPAQLSNTEQFDMRSSTGRNYRIFVSRPASEAPPEGFPVVYILDGNSVFGTAAEAARIQASALGPMVIVGIGYPVDTPFSAADRFLDFTPPTDPAFLPAHFGKLITGGQERFLDYIAQELRPEIERRYKINTGKQTLMGHSAGGHFVLFAMFTRPAMFQKYVAGSPSIWWNNRSLLKKLEAFASMPAEARSKVALSVILGSDEPGHLVLDARNLITALPPIHNSYLEVQGESHTSVLPIYIGRGLKFAASR